MASSPLSMLRVAAGRGEIFLGAAILAILAILFLPLPAWLLDFFFAVSISVSILVLMTALMIRKPLEFSVFPTVLLITTLFRLALNVASTRLILSEGHTGSAAAGGVIEAFGAIVMQGSFVIGLIVFIILVIVNFVVITRGSTRIAEVAARFALDSMPGKQMAIDADLSSGLITEAQAKARRREVEDESAFFGSMDGASKFVRGDAIAGLIITAINVLGGIIIGMTAHSLPFGEAADLYTRLTVGDGLVSQIPALITSVAAGLLVSKAGIDTAADMALTRQLAENPSALGLVAACAAIAGVIPGMPIAPFWALAAGAGWLAWIGLKRKRQQDAAPAQAAAAGPQVEEAPEAALAIDEVRIELGVGLLALLNDVQGRRLTDQIRALRKALAQELGFLTPPVRILDNIDLDKDDYSIRVREMEAGRGALRLESALAMDPSGRGVTLPGERVKEPTFGLDATWIAEADKEEALFRGYTVVDPATVLTTHLTEIIKEHMPDLLSYAETRKLIKELPKETQSLLDDAAPAHISWAGIQRVLQNLLRERISIRDLGAIVEAIAEAAPGGGDITLVTEHVRGRLSRQISQQYKGPDGAMAIVTLGPEWEQAFAESLIGERRDRQLSLAPSKLHQFVADVRAAFERAAQKGETPVLLTSPAIRPYVRSIIERFRPMTTVLSQNEIHPKLRLKSLGQV
jgi:flagellar biosynthesis protein FlhA